MFKYLIWSIIIYCLFRFIFNFVIPVFRATRQMKQQVKDFQDKMQQENQFQGTANEAQQRPQQGASKHPKKGDYIDFEEVR